MAVIGITEPLAQLGHSVGKSPVVHILWTLAFSLACMMGLTSLQFESDTDVLFVPNNSSGLVERQFAENNFTTDFDNYFLGHETRRDPEIQVILLAKDGEPMMRTQVWDEIVQLNETLAGRLTFRSGNRSWGYGDLCARTAGGAACVENNFLDLYPYIEQIVSGSINLTYPVMENQLSRDTYFFPRFFGGVTLKENSSELENVTAIRLTYPLNPRRESGKDAQALPLLWEQVVIDYSARFNFSHIQVHVISSKSIEQELMININTALDLFPYGLFLIIVFTIFNCMDRHNLEESRPVLGLVGVLCIFLATGSSWGILMHWFQVPWQSINLASIFLMLGVGLDNTFVMMGAWKSTSMDEGVMERMRKSYDDAAVSITITTACNVVSFVISAFTGFKCVEIFCIYVAAGLFAIYLWNLTLFGAFMAVSGSMDEWLRRNRGDASTVGWRRYIAYFTARERRSEVTVVVETERERNFFGDTLGSFLTRPVVKIAVISGLVAYLAISAYYISRVQEGLQRRFLALDDSAVVKFYSLEDAYYRDSPYRIQIILPDELQYWKPEVQDNVTAILQSFKDSKYISEEPMFEENWLLVFLQFAANQSLAIDTEAEFVQELSAFLSFVKDTPLGHDVKLSGDGNQKKILCSRFLLQTSAVADAVEEGKMMLEMRAIAASSPFRVVVFHTYFPYFDQYLEVLPQTLYSLAWGLAINFIITALLISNLWGIFWITFAILTIETGVFGFMVMWGINLDVISMISLNMCLGFSVDYSAHITNHFVRSTSLTSDEKVKDGLATYGLPIAQSAFATFLGVIVLFFIPSYILQSFAKMMMLVIAFGVMHGLIILPVLLSLFEPIASCKRQNPPDATDGNYTANKLDGNGIEENLELVEVAPVEAAITSDAAVEEDVTRDRRDSLELDVKNI